MRRFAITLALSAALAASAVAQPKRRVAVMNFDYATVRSSVAAVYGTDQDIGKGIADLIVENHRLRLALEDVAASPDIHAAAWAYEALHA